MFICNLPNRVPARIYIMNKWIYERAALIPLWEYYRSCAVFPVFGEFISNTELGLTVVLAFERVKTTVGLLYYRCLLQIKFIGYYTVIGKLITSLRNSKHKN